MAITTRDGLVAAMAAGTRARFVKTSVTSTAGRPMSTFRIGGQPSSSAGAPTTSGATCDRTTEGALAIPAPSNTTYLTGFVGGTSGLGTTMLYDRLVETGGLNGTTGTEQTIDSTALPSRATGGDQVELWLECYSALGSTPQATVTASYTNQGGTSGHTATLIGGIPASIAANTTLGPFALQAGDTGVRAVHSVTIGGSTGTVGSFGITLRRFLAAGVSSAPGTAANGFVLGWAETALQVVPDAACLEIVTIPGGSTTGTIMGYAAVAQG